MIVRCICGKDFSSLGQEKVRKISKTIYHQLLWDTLYGCTWTWWTTYSSRLVKVKLSMDLNKYLIVDIECPENSAKKENVCFPRY